MFVSNMLIQNSYLRDICTTHAQKRQIFFLWKVWRVPGVEIRITFLICYLQSLYEIKQVHYFCPEFVGHVTD